MKVLCLGNPIVPEDSVALEIADEIKNDYVVFEPCLSVDDFLREAEREEELILMDVARGIDKIEIIDDPDKIDLKEKFTLHDFDIGFFIKLLEGLGDLPKITIIAIPVHMGKEMIRIELPEVLKKIIHKNT